MWRDICKWLFKNVLLVAFTAVVLFSSAGTLIWPATWGYITTLTLIQGLKAVFLIRRNPALLAERAQFRPGTKSWDKLLAFAVALAGPSGTATLVIAGFGYRWRWTQAMPAWAHLTGLAFCFAGGFIIIWAMTSNEFFSPGLRIQTDRKHMVVSKGPYAHIRHPGYLGMIVFTAGVPLSLGSLWSFIPACSTVAMIILRAVLEERTLETELAGYQQYAATVRYRLVPGLW